MNNFFQKWSLFWREEVGKIMIGFWTHRISQMTFYGSQLIILREGKPRTYLICDSLCHSNHIRVFRYGCRYDLDTSQSFIFLLEEDKTYTSRLSKQSKHNHGQVDRQPHQKFLFGPPIQGCADSAYPPFFHSGDNKLTFPRLGPDPLLEVFAAGGDCLSLFCFP